MTIYFAHRLKEDYFLIQNIVHVVDVGFNAIILTSRF